MRRFFRQWLGLVLVAWTCACTRPIPAPAPPAGRIALAVVSWNTHAGTGDLRRLVGDLASGRLSGGVPREYVLLLQETSATGEVGDAAAVAAARGLAFFFAPVRTTAGRVSGNAILSTAPLSATRSFTLPLERQPRSAIIADVEIDGTRLFLVDVHLENRIAWWRGGLLSDSARGRQAEALLREIPSGAGIAGGDLNTWLGPAEPAWRAFVRRFADTPAIDRTPTFRERLVLDHLFFDLPGHWTATRRVVPDRYGSDHHPVVGIVSARAAP